MARPIKIGYLNSFTGSQASLGIDGKDGFELFLDSVNHTLAGRKVDVIYADDQAQPDVDLAKAKQLVENDKVDLLTGISSSAVCLAISQYVKQAQVPLVIDGNCGATEVTTSDKYNSPYLVRVSQTSGQVFWGMPEYAVSHGWKKLATITSDYVGGRQINDLFSTEFVDHGGTIVQELHPPLNTADFGPWVAQLSPNADAIAAVLPGADSLRFYQQYLNYGSKKQVLDVGSQIANGPVLNQLKQKAIGLVSSSIYSEAIDTPQNQALLKAFRAKYPGRIISSDVAQAWSGGQVIEAALNKVSGKVEDKQKFMQALDATDIQTAKGPVKVGSDHNADQNTYIFEMVAGGPLGFQQKLLSSTFNSEFGPFQPGLFLHFPYDKLSGHWVGMTKEQLDSILKTATS